MKATVKRSGSRSTPVLIAWYPITKELDSRDEVENVMFVTEEVEILCAVGDLLTDEELFWYQNNKNYRYVIMRGKVDED